MNCIAYYTLISVIFLFTIVESELNLKQLFTSCQESDLLSRIILPESTDNVSQLRTHCQNVTHTINSKQINWLKCGITCQPGYSLKNQNYPEIDINNSFFTCRRINSKFVYWNYQDGSENPDLQGCQVDTCHPPRKLRQNYKSNWEGRFYWEELFNDSKVGTLDLNLNNLRNNLKSFDFSSGWTLILKFENDLVMSNNSSAHYVQISKGLNIKSTEKGRVLSFTSNGHNNDIFTQNSTHFYNSKRVKFDIGFYAGFESNFEVNLSDSMSSQANDFEVSEIYLLEGQMTDVRCHFPNLNAGVTDIEKYGTIAEPIVNSLTYDNLQTCSNCGIGQRIEGDKCYDKGIFLKPAIGVYKKT